MREKKGAFGVVYQDVVRNPELTPESKAIYAYLASMAGDNDECYPSKELMAKEMHMSMHRLDKHLALLIGAGVVIKKRTSEGNLKSRNIYKVTHEVEIKKELDTIFENLEKMQNRTFRPVENKPVENKPVRNRHVENRPTNNNSINNNSINNNSNNIISCPEPETPDRQPIITLTLNDKTEHPIYTEDFDEWAELYPAVDIMQALRSMKGWLNANPTRRKTKNGIRRFINSWLSREQDRGKVWTAADKKEAYDSNADLKAWAGIDDYDREEIIDMEEQDE